MAILKEITKSSCYVLDDDQISDCDSVIATYIYNNMPDEDYSNIIAEDKRYYTRYHLSDYRASILRWLDFDTNSSVLEIDAEYGALTGALCDRCSSVYVTESSLFRAKMITQRYANRDNLTVYVGDVKDIEFEEKFDYIICLNDRQGAYSVEYIDFLHALLKDSGVLIFSINNKYGIDNLIGKKNKYTGIPFDSFSGKTESREFTKAQIKRLLDQSLFTDYKFFYPMPDSIAPRVLFTDDMQPEPDVINRLVTYCEDDNTLITSPEQIYFDAIDNGVLDFLANNFFIFAYNSLENSLVSTVHRVYLCGNKKREKATATILYTDKDDALRVKKKCLYPNGYKHLKKVHNMMSDLDKSGIDILGMDILSDSLDMAYVGMPTVHQYLEQLVSENAKENSITEVFDLIWQSILQSSVHTKDMNFDNKNIDMGVILTKAYVDMIITNCFWAGGNIKYFDQEYVRDNYPAVYVMYRNIALSYVYIPRLKDIISSETLYNRFGIRPEMFLVFGDLDSKYAEDENVDLTFCQSSFSQEKMKNNRLKILDNI